MDDELIQPELLATYPPDILRQRVSAETALAYMRGELSDLELLGHGIMNMDPQDVIDSWDDKHGPTTDELYQFCIQFPGHPVAEEYLRWRMKCVLEDIRENAMKNSTAYREYLKLADSLLK